jgi:hypothetical protein
MAGQPSRKKLKREVNRAIRSSYYIGGEHNTAHRRSETSRSTTITDLNTKPRPAIPIEPSIIDPPDESIIVTNEEDLLVSQAEIDQEQTQVSK